MRVRVTVSYEYEANPDFYLDDDMVLDNPEDFFDFVKEIDGEHPLEVLAMAEPNELVVKFEQVN